MTTHNAYQFGFKRSTGEEFALKSFNGKVLLIVNTASRCGFTKQYQQLEELYQKYQDRGLVVIGVPSNDFGQQDPGTDEEIQQFCQINFSTTFPIVKKEIVIGKHAHPFYLWAKKELGFWTGPKWNFHKYLLDRNGTLIDYFHSPITPQNPRLIKAIERLL